MSTKTINILVADAGDDESSIDEYIAPSKEICFIVEEKIPSANIFLVSQYLKDSAPYNNVRELIDKLIGSIEEYNLVIAYIPEPHMLNAMIVWYAYEKNIPAVVISQDDESLVLSTLSRIVPNIEGLEQLLNNAEFMKSVKLPH